MKLSRQNILKCKISIFFFCFCFSFNVFSQDLILTVNGESIESKVEEIGIKEITYHKFENLNGPIYIISKESVSKIVFENGTSEFFTNLNKKELVSIQETKSLIIEYINKYAFVWKDETPYSAEFEGDLLRLTKVNRRTGKPFPYSKLYDFTANCNFHELSTRGSVAFINVFPILIKRDKKMEGFKLVIGVKGPDNGRILREALMNYNEFFKI